MTKYGNPISLIRVFTTAFNNGFYVKIRYRSKTDIQHIISMRYTGDTCGLRAFLLQKLTEHGYAVDYSYNNQSTETVAIHVFTPIGALRHRLETIGMNVGTVRQLPMFDSVIVPRVTETGIIELLTLRETNRVTILLHTSGIELRTRKFS